tara:strand:- start:163 stop:459 length:297 start_codon:yes stop_codon:yes gene_type:complete
MSDKELTNEQIDDLISQFVQLKVDQMSTNDLIEHVKQDLTDYYNDWSIDELETIIDEELFEELVDNVTSESYVDSLLTSGTDYPPLVDTEATHDSEGC